jgi:integrase
MINESVSNSLIPTQSDTLSKRDDESLLAQVSQLADRAASNYIFIDYQQRRSTQTLRTHAAALLLWTSYLDSVNALAEIVSLATDWASNNFIASDLRKLEEYAKVQNGAIELILAAHFCQSEPAAWQGISWGLVEGFVKWLLNQGYSINSVNNRLASIRVYVRLAAKAGTVSPAEHALIREVRGYGQTEGKRIDEKRPCTRIGHKKEEAIVLTAQQARQFKNSHPPTPQGIRDRLMICLLLDLGLRASELASLSVSDFVKPGNVVVYRQKTDTTDRMALSADIRRALADYEPYLRQSGILLRGSRKGGKLTDDVMSVRAIGSRVKTLGRDILDIWELSPHDLRHTWATQAAKHSNPFVLRDAGGWTNMQTPSRYVARAKTVNEGIKLDY